MTVNLFYLSPHKNLIGGGTSTYPYHILESFKRLGYDVHMYVSTGSVTSGNFKSLDAVGIDYSCLSPEEILFKCESNSSMNFIIASHWGNSSESLRALILSMIQRNVVIIFHAPWELSTQLIPHIEEHSTKVTCVGKQLTNHKRLANVNSHYVPHMYIRYSGNISDELLSNSVCASRIDAVNHIDVILQANKQLSDDYSIHLYGSVTNSYFRDLMKLEYDIDFDSKAQTYVDALKEYQGIFDPRNAVNVLSKYVYAVDLTDNSRSGDGGRTQYAFLEAFDAEIPLVINHNWINEDDELNSSVCIPVSNSDELVDIINTDPEEYESNIDAGLELLDKHSPEVVIPKLVDLFN